MNKTFDFSEFKKEEILFVFALEMEAGNEFEDCQVLITGLGKVNATFALTKYLQNHQPKLIVNLGTAGSKKFNRGEVVCCTQFIQRDMDVTEIGFPKYRTPFSDEPEILDYGLNFKDLNKAICGTGDQFETQLSDQPFNVVDMESYALALVAKRENIPFLCLKYISDGADDSAAEDWNEQVKRAAKKLKSYFMN